MVENFIKMLSDYDNIKNLTYNGVELREFIEGFTKRHSGNFQDGVYVEPIEDISKYYYEGLPNDKQRSVVEYLLDIIREETPHGECGASEISRKVIINGIIYLITLTGVQWNRYDKQYYFIDNYDPPVLTIEDYND